MIHGQDIICISSIDWDFNWQGHQEIMSTFAQHGNRVLFIENTGVRTPTIRDVGRLKRRLLAWLKSLRGFRQVQDRVWVYSPVIFPFPYSRPMRWVNRHLLLRAIHRWMRATGFHDPILWTFLPTGIALDLITHLNHKLSVYYCIADFDELVSDRRKVQRTEREVVRRCDLIFAQGEVLRQKCAQWNPKVHIFPFGVKLEMFDDEAQPPLADEPEELRCIPRPILGYVGGLHRHVDFELLRHLAAQRPDWSIVLVGPLQADASALSGARNVFLLGERAITQLPRYIQMFDVGLIPYVNSAYTRTVYPTKLNEYHALGKPVVSTALPEVVAFNEHHGRLIFIAEHEWQFVEQVEQALGQRHGLLADQRRAVAREQAWSRRIERMSLLLEEHLRRRSDAAPIGWQERLSAFYGQTRRRTLQVAGALLLGYVLVFHSPAVWWAAAPLKISQPPVPSDAIVVFAGGVGESGKAGQGYEERVAWAVDLYKRGYAPHLIFSSGYSYAFQEAQLMKVLAASLGVPEQAITLEEQATNTYQNVLLTNRLLDRYKWKTILLVSSPYHMRRAAMVWHAVAPDKRVMYVPIPMSHFYGEGRPLRGWLWPSLTVERIGGVLHEYLGIAYYWWKGYL